MSGRIFKENLNRNVSLKTSRNEHKNKQISFNLNKKKDYIFNEIENKILFIKLRLI